MPSTDLQLPFPSCYGRGGGGELGPRGGQKKPDSDRSVELLILFLPLKFR